MSNAPAKNERSPSNTSSNPKTDVQKIAEIKEYLEGKISELELEISKLKDMLHLVDANLREQSFVPAIALQKAANSSTSGERALKLGADSASHNVSSTQREVGKKPGDSQMGFPQDSNARELRRTRDSMLVANAFVSSDRVVVVPAKNVKLSQTTPPFEPFFINRILRGFQNKDEQEAKTGKIKPSEVLRYDIQEFEGNIANVTVVNYRDTSRLNEILNTVTWAFTKMIEKK